MKKIKSNPVARANKNRPQVIPNKKIPKRSDLKDDLKKELLDKPNRKWYNSIMDNIITPNKFALIIENIVKEKRTSYMDAIVSYCDKTGLDPATIRSLVNKTLKEKIAYEAQGLNMLKEKTAKLPI